MPSVLFPAFVNGYILLGTTFSFYGQMTFSYRQECIIRQHITRSKVKENRIKLIYQRIICIILLLTSIEKTPLSAKFDVEMVLPRIDSILRGSTLKAYLLINAC